MTALFLTLMISAALPAPQLSKIGELSLAPNDLATGVSLDGTRAHVSLFTSGVQWTVDCSNPASPVPVATFNPQFGDQYGEHYYFDNQMVMGHRFGGLNLWDVSGVPFERSTASTNYHFDGLDTLTVGTQKILFYSEVNAFGARGGLRIYDVTAGSLSEIGNWVQGNNTLDGRFLVATSDQWVYQFDGGAGSPRPQKLNVYDCTNLSSPQLVWQRPLDTTLGNYIGMPDMELDPTENFLYAACAGDGLRILNVSVRSTPTILRTFNALPFSVMELDWFGVTAYMAVSIREPNLEWRFGIVNCSNPTSPQLVGAWMGDAGFFIRDIKAETLAGVPTLLVVGSDIGGQAVLQIWQ